MLNNPLRSEQNIGNFRSEFCIQFWVCNITVELPNVFCLVTSVPPLAPMALLPHRGPPVWPQ